MNITAPIVVDLGKTDDDSIADLRSGGGQIAADVGQVMRLLQTSGNPQFGNRLLLPVVGVYSRARKHREEKEAIAADNL
jgi:hypothetical protein